MATLWNHVPDFSRLTRRLGEELVGFLVCRTCGHREECDESRAALCLARGWPQHCGETMSLERLGDGPGEPQEAPRASPATSGPTRPPRR
jgi:hypothetical protein